VARFFVRADAVEDDRVTFDAAEARHLGRVLRLGPGDVVHAVDGRGQEWTVRLTEVGARAASGLVVERRSRPRESQLDMCIV
jgi:16S rRNA (uracil1498-N3)-methyltransferase